MRYFKTNTLSQAIICIDKIIAMEMQKDYFIVILDGAKEEIKIVGYASNVDMQNDYQQIVDLLNRQNIQENNLNIIPNSKASDLKTSSNEGIFSSLKSSMFNKIKELENEPVAFVFTKDYNNILFTIPAGTELPIKYVSSRYCVIYNDNILFGAFGGAEYGYIKYKKEKK